MQYLIDFHQDIERNIIIGNDFIFKFEEANGVQDGKKKKKNCFKQQWGKCTTDNRSFLSILTPTKNLSYKNQF